MQNGSLTACRPWKLYFQNTDNDSKSCLAVGQSHLACLCWSLGNATAADMALVEQGDSAPPENCHRLVILGSAKVGKTAIVSRFLANKFDENYTPTIEDFHRKIYRIRGAPYRLDILDTSGNHPFPAMRRLSFITGDLFILVYSIDSRESFEEAIRLREQILECKGHCAGLKSQKTLDIPMVIVGNKADKESERVVEASEVTKQIEGQHGCAFVESSAKKSVNVDEVFLRLFEIAKLPSEMSPSMHRRVQPTYIGSTSGNNQRKGMSIRRKMSDACGTVAPNVRRPSIRTDLLVAQTRTGRTKTSPDGARESKCLIQ
ncbi:GTP-binding protein Rhes-like isoform X1 [Octopus vulgaris]|nr:GTP-binding protein Rhes-like isoform X1 [Octopus vulgaris]